MPEPDAVVLAARREIVAGLRRILEGEGVIADDESLIAYESDGLTAYRQKPLAVALPRTTVQVAAILKFCKERAVKVVARGAGTSLSGGALPLEDGVILEL
jgi:glycolate oxidase